MTWSEYNERVWRAAGLTEAQIAAGHAQNEKAMEPGWNQKQAVLAPGRTMEQAIASGVRAFQAFRAMPNWAKIATHAILDEVIERDNRKN